MARRNGPTLLARSIVTSRLARSAYHTRSACSACATDLPPGSRFCPRCGSATGADDPAAPTATVGLPSWTSSSVSEGRFPPGTMLAQRYRIVGRLGRGGMGEVYRADDMKLAQPAGRPMFGAGWLEDWGP